MTGRNVPGYNAVALVELHSRPQPEPAVKAAIFCARKQIGEIALAPLESNPFPDARPEFFRAFARAVELGVGIKLKIRTPFAGLSKAEVVRRGAEHAARIDGFMRPPERYLHCGACTKCAERVEGFLEAKLPDPTLYARMPKRPQC